MNIWKQFQRDFTKKMRCKRGGGGTTIETQAPPPPTITDTMGQYVESLPALYQAQMEYAPQLAQQQLDLLQQFGAPMGQAYQEAQQAMNPETFALQEQMAGQAGTGMEEGLTEDEKQLYRDQFAANLGTNAGSGMGANYMGNSMMQADLARKDYYRNLGLSLAQRQPLAQPQVQGAPNWMQEYTPGQALGYGSNTYGSWANSYSSAYQPGAGAQLGGAAIGAAGNILGGAATGFFSSKRFKKNIRLWE